MSTFRSKYKKYKRARSASKRYYKSKYKRRYKSIGAKSGSRYGWKGNYAQARKAVKGLAEKKFTDTYSSGISCRQGGQLTLINGISMGSDFNNRVGRKINITSVEVTGWFYPGLTCKADRVRMLLVWDQAPNGSLPNTDNILTDMGGGVTSFSFMNLNWRERFRVLAEETFTLGFVLTTAPPNLYPYTLSPAVANFSRYLKTDLTVEYSGTGDQIGAISTGALYVLIVGMHAINEGHYCTFNARIRYIDC